MNTQRLVFRFPSIRILLALALILGLFSAPRPGQATWGPAGMFNAGGTQLTSVAALSASKIVVAYRDNGNSAYGTAVVGDISGDTITYGAEYVFHAAITYSSIDVIPLSASKFVVVYIKDEDYSHGAARVGDVSGTTITWGAEFEFNAAGTGYLTGAALSATQFVVTYYDTSNSNYGAAQVGTVTGSSIAFGSKYVFHTYTTYAISVAALSSTQIVVTYMDASTVYGYATVGTVSGTAITYGAKYVFNAATTNNINVAALTASKFVVAYRDNGNSGAGTAVVGDVNGTAITYGAESVFQTRSGMQSVNILGASGMATLSGSQFAVGYDVYDDDSGTYYGYVNVGSVSGSAITFGSRTDVNAGAQSQDVAVATLSSSAFTVGWGDMTANAGKSRLNISTTGPTVDTPTSAAIGVTTATLGGTVSNTGGANVTERGVYWGTASGFTLPGEGAKVSDTGDWGSPGAFTKAVSSLPANTPIYFKAFATNSVGTGFSSQAGFTTLEAEPTNHPTGFGATANSGTQVATSWTDAAGGVTPDSYLALCNTTGSFTDPVDGVAQADDATCADGSGAMNIAQGVGTYAWSGLDGATRYYYKIFPYAGSGSGINYKTDGAPPTAAATTHCVAATSGSWSAQFGACPTEAKRIIAPGVTVTPDGDVTLTGDFEIQPGGTFNANGKTVTLSGSAAQTLTGNPLTFYNLVVNKTDKTNTVTTVGKLKVTKKLTITRGKLISASDYGDIAIGAEGELELTSDITVGGDFTKAELGTFTPYTYTTTFDGATTQNVTLGSYTDFGKLVVYTDTILVETDPSNSLFVSTQLINYDTIRKTQAISALASYDFGLAGDYAGGYLALNVTTDDFASITVARRHQDHPGRTGSAGVDGVGWGIYWTITPVGTGTVDLTLPHALADDTKASACRFVSGTTWNCNRTSSAATSVTRNGVSSFSDWAVGNNAPLAGCAGRAGRGQRTRPRDGALGDCQRSGHARLQPLPRGRERGWMKLNAAMLPSQAPGSPFDFSYAYQDAPVTRGGVYRYRLAAVALHGQETPLATVAVTAPYWLWLTATIVR